MMPSPSLPPLLQRLASALRIAHHIPGRVRLKLDPASGGALASVLGDVTALHRALSGSPGIHSVSVNALALSCTIEYDPGRIPSSAWADVLNGAASPGAETLLRILAAAGLGPDEQKNAGQAPG